MHGTKPRLEAPYFFREICTKWGYQSSGVRHKPVTHRHVFLTLSCHV